MQIEPSSNRPRGLFSPFLVLLLAVVVSFAFQTSQLILDRINLATLKTNQETTFRNAQKMRSQLDSIAAGTARLAEKGNINASNIVGALRAKGISINPDKLNETANK